MLKRLFQLRRKYGTWLAMIQIRHTYSPTVAKALYPDVKEIGVKCQ